MLLISCIFIRQSGVQMLKFKIFIDWGYRVGDGGNRDDIAAGEGYDTKVDIFPYTGSRDEVEEEALRLVADHSPCFRWWIEEDKKAVESITEIVDILKDTLNLPEAQSLVDKIEIVSNSVKRYYPITTLYSKEYSAIFITSKGLNERIGKSGTKFVRTNRLTRIPFDESKSRIVSESEFESMVTKYHLTSQDLQEVRTELKKLKNYKRK